MAHGRSGAVLTVDDAFVTALKADGSAAAYSTFVGGSGGDGAPTTTRPAIAHPVVDR